MPYHHAVTWANSDFDQTAHILSFRTRAERDAFSEHSHQRYEPITHVELQRYLRAGKPQALIALDSTNPAGYVRLD